MPDFFARVELHGNADYKKLHDLMAGMGWRTTLAHDGLHDALPTATYSRSGPYTVEALQDQLTGIIDNSMVSEGPAWILVIESAHAVWRTLTIG